MHEEYVRTYMLCDSKQQFHRVIIAYCGLLFLIFLLLLGLKCQAKTIYFGKDAEEVRVSAGAPTLFRFPMEVKNILRGERFTIKPASDDNPNYAILSVEPHFSTGASEVLFLLSDGETVSLKLMVVPKGATTETNYTFQAKDESGESHDSNEGPKSSSEIELLKQMIRGDQVNSYKILDKNLEIESKGNARIHLVRIYDGVPFTGYIYKIKNDSSRKELSIDVRDLSLGKPNLAILAQIDDSVLATNGKPGSETYLRVVSRPGANSNGLIVPMNEGPQKLSATGGSK